MDGVCCSPEVLEVTFRYLDDFVVVGPPDSPACLEYLFIEKDLRGIGDPPGTG